MLTMIVDDIDDREPLFSYRLFHFCLISYSGSGSTHIQQGSNLYGPGVYLFQHILQ